MPAHARKEIVRDGEIAVYHTWSRCVQRAWLCGQDAYTGENYDHRREWIRKLLEYQASIFALDVGNYAILSNHEHLICRTRPDIAETWSDEEVAWRWKRAWPKWKNGEWIREPTDEEVNEVLAQSDRIPLLRRNLASLSWFHARWKEPIAKLANQESERRGHFWEARFGSRELEGEPEILSCSIYLDLNQLKAGMSPSLAASDHSGIQDRIRAWQQQQAQKSVKKFHKRKDPPGNYQLEPSRVEQLLADCFLAPIDQVGPLILAKEPAILIAERSSPQPQTETSTEIADADRQQSEQTSEPDEPADSGDASGEFERGRSAGRGCATRSGKQTSRKIHGRLLRKRRRRASDNVFLPMPFPQYLQIAEWAAERISGSGPDPPAEDLELLRAARQWEPLHWRPAAADSARWFHQAAAKSSQFSELLSKLGGNRSRGSTRGRDGFT